MKEKVILAYSGGLDTTAIIPWLKENFDYDVVCCCIDCGQGNELDGLEERAKLSGATKLYIEDVVDEFCDEYIIPCVQAGAVYENKYLLGTSMARPVIAKRLVEIARKEGATAICHGATGKGNDQIRFELGIKALAPDLKIIAPWVRCRDRQKSKGHYVQRLPAEPSAKHRRTDATGSASVAWKSDPPAGSAAKSHFLSTPNAKLLRWQHRRSAGW